MSDTPRSGTPRSGTPRSAVRLGSRRSTYALVIGVVVGMLAAGLGIPFVFGESLSTVSTASSPLVPREEDTLATDQGAATAPAGGDQGAVAADGGGGGGNVPGATGAGGAATGGGGGGRGPGVATAPSAGSGNAAPAAGAAAGPAPPGVTLTASDRGVTPTTITLAFMLVDLGGVSQVGFSVPGFDPESQKAYVNAFVNSVNAKGGIFGRKLVPKFFSYDPTNPSSGQAACRSATQDNAVFAAIDSGGGLDFPGQLCFTDQNRTPLIEFGGFGTTQEMYAKSAGRLVTLLPSGIRMLANTAVELDRQGLLKGKTIGILDRDFPGATQTVTDGMVATLAQLGYKVAYRSTLSMDNGVAASQVPLAVQQMRSTGVDTVMILTDFIIGTQFVQTADRSGWTPAYYVSDFASMTNDVALSAMPPSFRGTGITTMRNGEWRANVPEPAADAACRKTFAASSGKDPDRSENDYGGALLACGLVDIFVRGATAAGPELTRGRWVAGVQQIGAIPFPNFGSMSFKKGKVDGADAIRTIRFGPSCPPGKGGGGNAPCWMPAGGFRPSRY